MTLPDYQSLMAPFLNELADGQAHAVRDVADQLANHLALPEAELSEPLPSGKITVWRSRVHWASQYLYQAGAITRSRRGIFVITDRGRALLANHPDRVGNDELMQFEEFRDFKQRARSAQRTAEPLQSDVEPASQWASPQDRLESAVSEANATVAADLLRRINEQPPVFLERVVLDLLVALGYAGAMGRAEQLGRSGDEGVDGVVREDALGLDRIYVQAKRYGSGRTVGRPEIQAFVGALHGAQASRGVFITTSRFSREAVDYVDRVPQRVVLIDGDELTRLMVEHGVGVQAEQTYVLRRVDEDFFEA